MKNNLLAICVILGLFLLPVSHAFASVLYTRSPSDVSPTSPITVTWSDLGGGYDHYHSYLLDVTDGIGDWNSAGSVDWGGSPACHVGGSSINSGSETISVPVGTTVNNVAILLWNDSSDCSTSVAGAVNLEGNGSSTIFTIIAPTGGVAPGDPTPTPASSTTTTTTIVIVTATPTPTPIPLKDTVAPTISLDTDFGKPFREAPKITGKASDGGAINVGVAKIEYSIDDGKNWLPVDSINNQGAKSTSFSFTPPAFEDGNYKLRVRAKDPTGNVGISNTYTLIIDRLPPQVGGVLFSLGPQVLIPTKEGIIFTLQGLNTKITLSAVGGPLTIDLYSDNKTQNLSVKTSLVKNLDNGLWSGLLTLAQPGVYQLTAKAVDGADNRTDRLLNSVVVLESGKILYGTSPVTTGTVMLWHFDSQTQRFVIWDGTPYGQSNLQRIGKDGKYGFIVPPGKYYLEVKSYGFKTMRSEIFTVNENIPITSTIKLERSFGINIGPFFLALPDFSVSQQSINVNYSVISSDTQLEDNVAGNEFPNVDLFKDENSVSTINFRGKPTVFTFLSTWSPYTSEQLNLMEDLSGNAQINILPIINQETASSVSIFKKRGGYSLSILADPDGLLVKPLNLSFLPTHIFVDRKGIIRNVIIGVLTKDEILKNVID